MKNLLIFFFVFISCNNDKNEDVRFSDQYDISVVNIDHNKYWMIFSKDNIAIDSFVYTYKHYRNLDMYDIVEDKYWNCAIIAQESKKITERNELARFQEKCINTFVRNEHLKLVDLDEVIHFVNILIPNIISNRSEEWHENLSYYYENAMNQDTSTNIFKLDVCEKIVIERIYHEINNLESGAIYFTNINSEDTAKGNNFGFFHKYFYKLTYGVEDGRLKFNFRDLSLNTRTFHFE